MANQERQDLQDRISKNLSDANLWTKLWSAVHHTFLFSGAALSAIAAVVLQLDESISEISLTDLATLFAGAAALSSTIAGSGGFARKWKTNRLIKTLLTQLEIDLIKPTADYDAIRENLKKIIQLRYDGIIGTEQVTKEST